MFGELNGLVDGQVQTAVGDVLLDPARQLASLVCASVALEEGKVDAFIVGVAGTVVFAVIHGVSQDTTWKGY